MMGMHQNKEVLNLLKTTRGQLDGIIKMVEDDRYCVDVSKQLLAVQALLRKANLKVIDNHIRGCVKDAIHDGQGDEKITEIMDIISKYAK
jgi:CsoR family transcriptional regulator, copper-sensing transcriptional repressor